LSLAYQPKSPGATEGHGTLVDWSSDGKTLAAAGTWDNLRVAIRRWSKAGLGPSRDASVSPDTILNVRGLPGNRFLFVSDPGLGVLESKETYPYTRRSVTAEFKSKGQDLRVSPDGSLVAFDFRADGSRPARFSIADRELRLVRAKEPSSIPLHSAR